MPSRSPSTQQALEENLEIARSAGASCPRPRRSAPPARRGGRPGRDEYADKVGGIDASWEGEDRLKLMLTIMGMDIGSEVEILVAELVVRVDVPGMAGLFAGRIKDGIQERLGGLLGAPAA